VSGHRSGRPKPSAPAPDNEVPRRCYATVDESKRTNRPYTMVMAYVPPGEVTALRGALRRQLFKGQRSLHFTKERDATKRAVLALFVEHGVRAVVVEVPRHHTRETPRDVCIRHLARHAHAADVQALVFDRDESLVPRDRKVLFEELNRSDVGYTHRQRHEDELLWVADAIAWAYTKDATWRSMVNGLVVEVLRPVQ